jgi:hypothetical protein
MSAMLVTKHHAREWYLSRRLAEKVNLSSAHDINKLSGKGLVARTYIFFFLFRSSLLVVLFDDLFIGHNQ